MVGFAITLGSIQRTQSRRTAQIRGAWALKMECHTRPARCRAGSHQSALIFAAFATAVHLAISDATMRLNSSEVLPAGVIAI